MDEFYKLLVMFKSGEPITGKRLLKIESINPELIQKALDEGLIIKTTCSDIGDDRYLITAKGQKIL